MRPTIANLPPAVPKAEYTIATSILRRPERRLHDPSVQDDTGHEEIFLNIQNDRRIAIVAPGSGNHDEESDITLAPLPLYFEQTSKMVEHLSREVKRLTESPQVTCQGEENDKTGRI